MTKNPAYDAIVVGSGPNGLAAGITIAQANRSVLVVEANDEIGGGTRSGELTLPGFTHDLCSAVHPMALQSAFLQSLPLQAHGLEWIHPTAPLAHPLDDGSAILLDRSIQTTAEGLESDSDRYRQLFTELGRDWPQIKDDLLGPLSLPHSPWLLAKFGMKGLQPASVLAQTLFQGERARALWAGLAAHSVLPLEKMTTGAVALVLGLSAHISGWPLARGGSKSISLAMGSYLRSLGGVIQTKTSVKDLRELPTSGLILLDLTPRQIWQLSGTNLSANYRKKLQKYRYGPGVFKLDWALDAPIPWRAAECGQAATVHLGGSFSEIAQSERAAWKGGTEERPFVLLVQPTLFDTGRAPANRQIAWAYCHVPNGSTIDMTERIEQQVERFAPGFKDHILSRHIFTPQTLELSNANLVGGDIGGGAMNLSQLFFRPTLGMYATSRPDLFICSSSTPPGGGVHGLCGYHAAQAALRGLKEC